MSDIGCIPCNAVKRDTAQSARLDLLLQAGRQTSIHDQLALESGRKTIAFGQTRRQMIVVSAIPVADILVTVGIAVMNS